MPFKEACVTRSWQKPLVDTTPYCLEMRTSLASDVHVAADVAAVRGWELVRCIQVSAKTCFTWSVHWVQSLSLSPNPSYLCDRGKLLPPECLGFSHSTVAQEKKIYLMLTTMPATFEQQLLVALKYCHVAHNWHTWKSKLFNSPYKSNFWKKSAQVSLSYFCVPHILFGIVWLAKQQVRPTYTS